MRFRQRIVCSLIAEYFKAEKFLYSLSVFVPETGFSGNILSPPELKQIFKVAHGGENPLLDALVGGLLDESLGGYRKTQEREVQTDTPEPQLTLEQKLSRIDSEYTATQHFPYKDLEERMVKYKSELESQMRRELEEKVRQVKEIEVAAVRIGEANRFKAKLEEYRNQLQEMQSEKLNELRKREGEVAERCRLKERELEKLSFDHRQVVLKDMEAIRLREKEVRKELEMRVNEVENEKTALKELQAGCEQKVKDAERMREKLDDEVHSRIEA